MVDEKIVACIMSYGMHDTVVWSETDIFSVSEKLETASRKLINENKLNAGE